MRIVSLLTVFFVCLGVSFASAKDVLLADTTVVPGVRVGPIKKGVTVGDLQKLFGRNRVTVTELPGPEGTTINGVRLFENSDRELEILLDPENPKKAIWDIRVLGKAWTFENGLKLGQTLTEVEKVNGMPFKLTGFDWDYGGYASFPGGSLDGKVSVRFDPGEAPVPDELSGDQEINTTNKKLRKLNPKVSELTVYFR